MNFSTPLTNILLVDDEPDIRIIAQKSLEAIGGYTVESCIDGNDAISKVAGFNPDLILMDVMMPGKDGPATLAALREDMEWRGVPVVFMTARIQKGEIEEYLSLGAAGVIEKPFDPMTLSSKIQHIWSALLQETGGDCQWN